MMNDWMSAGNKWMQQVANDAYAAFCQTKNGKKFAKSKMPGKSPYQFGFSLPDWFPNAIDALNKGDEERFKAIKLIESKYL